jgi:hypothetical protein
MGPLILTALCVLCAMFTKIGISIFNHDHLNQVSLTLSYSAVWCRLSRRFMSTDLQNIAEIFCGEKIHIIKRVVMDNRIQGLYNPENASIMTMRVLS